MILPTTLKGNDWNSSVKAVNDQNLKDYIKLDNQLFEAEGTINKLKIQIDDVQDDINQLIIMTNFLDDLLYFATKAREHSRSETVQTTPNWAKTDLDKLDPQRGTIE